jgi:hypothetical protein
MTTFIDSLKSAFPNARIVRDHNCAGEYAHGVISVTGAFTLRIISPSNLELVSMSPRITKAELQKLERVGAESNFQKLVIPYNTELKIKYFEFTLIKDTLIMSILKTGAVPPRVQEDCVGQIPNKTLLKEFLDQPYSEYLEKFIEDDSLVPQCTEIIRFLGIPINEPNGVTFKEFVQTVYMEYYGQYRDLRIREFGPILEHAFTIIDPEMFVFYYSVYTTIAVNMYVTDTWFVKELHKKPIADNDMVVCVD